MDTPDELAMAQVIETMVKRVVDRLGVWARHMAARYNGPVYLTGSVLHNPTPRDIDLRIICEDYEFASRFGHKLVEFDPPRPKGHRRDTSVHYTRGIDWDACGPTQRWIDDLAKTASAPEHDPRPQRRSAGVATLLLA